jgi:GNAT superfamily N-acetyltransferase
MNWTNGDYHLTDDTSKLDLGIICFLLGSTYWAANRSREVIEKSLRHSLCLGLFHGGHQVGFGRLITDRATFSYLCDVIVHPDHRRKGLGKWMVQCALEHQDIAGTRVALFTKDAHALYEQFGFGKHTFDCLVRPPAIKAERKAANRDSSNSPR